MKYSLGIRFLFPRQIWMWRWHWKGSCHPLWSILAPNLSQAYPLSQPYSCTWSSVETNKFFSLGTNIYNWICTSLTSSLWTRYISIFHSILLCYFTLNSSCLLNDVRGKMGWRSDQIVNLRLNAKHAFCSRKIHLTTNIETNSNNCCLTFLIQLKFWWSYRRWLISFFNPCFGVIKSLRTPWGIISNHKYYVYIHIHRRSSFWDILKSFSKIFESLRVCMPKPDRK